MADEINLDRDWSIDLNVSGINAPVAGAKDLNLPEGYFKAVISDMYINHERSPNRVVIKLMISDGPFSGVVRTSGLGLPKDEADKVRYYWRGLAESAGYTPAQLDAGAITINREVFVNRSVHMHYTPKDKTASGYEQIDFLPPVEWNQQKQMFDAREKIEAPAGESKTVAPPSQSPSTSTTTKADVLSKLGLGA